MPWGKLDDSLYDNPKLDKLGQHRMAGVGLWAVAISWCNRWLTDGALTIERVRALGGTTRQAEALVLAGLFDREGAGAYRVHDFLDFNDSRAEVMERRAAAATRQRKVRGVSQRDSQRDIAGSHDGSHSTPPRALPVPSRPDHSPDPAAMPATEDPADAYWSLTGRYPTDKPLHWIDDLTASYGAAATIKAIAQAHIADPKTNTLLGRAQDILRAGARALDRAEVMAEKQRLREKRAIPKVIPEWEQEFRAALEAKYGGAA